MTFSALPPHHFFINRFTWCFLAAIGVVDLLWLRIAGMGVDTHNSLIMALTLAGCLGISAAFRSRGNDVLYLFFQSASQLIVGAVVITGFSYISARLALPLRDQELIAADRLLFFDWRAWLAWLNTCPRFAQLLNCAYLSSDLQFPVLLLGLLYYNRMAHLQKFILTFFFSGVVVITLGAMFPSVAGYMYYNIDLAQFQHLHPAAPRDQEIPLLGMRAHTMTSLPLKFDGVVQFPSFHSVLAILFVYASLPIRWLTIIAIPLNVLMLMSTPVDGGHYLMDVLAGVMIALVIIHITERMFSSMRLRGEYPEYSRVVRHA